MVFYDYSCQLFSCFGVKVCHTFLVVDFDYAELSQPASGDDVVWIEQGQKREISLNVSAGPTTESVISRVDGSEVSSLISINQSIAVTQAGREISGTYNATVSNLAGCASFLINIQVFGECDMLSTVLK